MNWSKVLLAGVIGGVITSVVSFLMHGVIMAGTYTTYDDVFSQEQANPAWFFLVGIVIAIAAAVIFSKTRACWRERIVGGVQFGAMIGLVVGLVNFYWPLVLAGFPYYLTWCWLGIDLIVYCVLGAVLAIFIKRS